MSKSPQCFTVGVDNREAGDAGYTCRGSGDAVCEIGESFERSEEEALPVVGVHNNSRSAGP